MDSEKIISESEYICDQIRAIYDIKQLQKEKVDTITLSYDFFFTLIEFTVLSSSTEKTRGLKLKELLEKEDFIFEVGGKSKKLCVDFFLPLGTIHLS
jgi:hypothetical protein